jgi:hypothetical protein
MNKGEVEGTDSFEKGQELGPAGGIIFALVMSLGLWAALALVLWWRGIVSW